MSIYRKIYESHYGSIPKDENGRTYEIHHIDGNRKNNNPSNLIALSIQEHYDTHYKQGDYAACMRIINRMNMSLEEISAKATEINKQRAKEGKHPSQTKSFKEKLSIVKKEEISKGIHPFCNKQKMSEWASKGSRERVKNGTHHLLSGDIQSKTQKRKLKEGKHNFQFFPKLVCPHCNKEGRYGPMKQWHFDKCKMK